MHYLVAPITQHSCVTWKEMTLSKAKELAQGHTTLQHVHSNALGFPGPTPSVFLKLSSRSFSRPWNTKWGWGCHSKLHGENSFTTCISLRKYILEMFCSGDPGQVIRSSTRWVHVCEKAWGLKSTQHIYSAVTLWLSHQRDCPPTMPKHVHLSLSSRSLPPPAASLWTVFVGNVA